MFLRTCRYHSCLTFQLVLPSSSLKARGESCLACRSDQDVQQHILESWLLGTAEVKIIGGHQCRKRHVAATFLLIMYGHTPTLRQLRLRRLPLMSGPVNLADSVAKLTIAPKIERHGKTHLAPTVPLVFVTPAIILHL